MDILTKFELKKILQRKSTRGAIIALFIASIISLVIVVYTESFGSKITDNLYQGISAIQKRNTESKLLSGPLNEKKISQVIKLHNDLRIKSQGKNDYNGLNDVAYFSQWQKYEDIDLLINRASGPLNSFDYNLINKLKPNDGKRFYLNRSKQISNFINQSATPEYSNKEKEKIMTKVNNMETPLYYNYTSGWKGLIKEMSSFNIFMILVVCICVAPVFSSEYQTGADSIVLPTKYGRNKLIKAKFKASFIFTTVLYCIAVVVISGIRLSIYGFTGWNCKIQISSTYWHSMYNINFLQAFLLAALLGYIACLVSTSIVMFLSAKLKTPFTVIIVSLAIIFIPMFFDTGLMPKYISYGMDLLPIKIIDVNNILGYYKFYNIFGILVSQPLVMILSSIVFIIILLPFTYRFFRKHEVV